MFVRLESYAEAAALSLGDVDGVALAAADLVEHGLACEAERVRGVLERIPPEVASDVHDSGLVLTGGIAHLAGMDARVSSATRLQVSIAESPRQSVARGLIALYDQPLLLRRVARNIELS